MDEEYSHIKLEAHETRQDTIMSNIVSTLERESIDDSIDETISACEKSKLIQ